MMLVMMMLVMMMLVMIMLNICILYEDYVGCEDDGDDDNRDDG